MKKILIATTALVATAGVASADVSLSGDARMGVIYDGSDLNFTSRTRAQITLSGESDGGLSFGGSFDMHNAGDASSGLSGSAFVSGEFGKISMGDVDGAAKAAVGQVDGVGLTGLDDLNEVVYVNGGTDVDGDASDDTIYPNPAALYEFTTGAFSFYAGAGDPAGKSEAESVLTTGGPTSGNITTTTLSADETYSVGAKWAANGFSIGLGFETVQAALTVSDTLGTFVPTAVQGTISQIIIGASAEFGDFTIKGIYGDISTSKSLGGGGDQWAISGTYAMDALSVTAFYSDISIGIGSAEAYGLGAAYDLGGGLSVKGGVVNDRGGDTIADFGVSMSF
jgi:outer membrane protein OmpU